MSVRVGWSVEVALAAFDEHLRRARGLCGGTRTNWGRFAGAFLEVTFPDGEVTAENIFRAFADLGFQRVRTTTGLQAIPDPLNPAQHAILEAQQITTIVPPKGSSKPQTGAEYGSTSRRGRGSPRGGR